MNNRLLRLFVGASIVLSIALIGRSSSADTAPAAGTFDQSLLYQNCSNGSGLLGALLGGSTDAQTKYPIVLVSGLTGSAPNWLVPGGEYWNQIPQTLCQNGATVYVASLSAVNSDIVRGEELVQQLKLLMAKLKVDRVNLVGHSMGGWTVRYAAAIFPEGIASVTTVSSPHKGTEFASYFLDHGPVVLKLGEVVFNVFGSYANALNQTAYPVDADAAVHQASPAGMAKFNAMFPSAGLSSASCTGKNDDTGVRGNTDTRTGTDGKQYVQKLYSFTGNAPASLDSLDVAGNVVMTIASAMMRSEGAGTNDGLAGVCSSRFGAVLGTYRWNHINAINNLFGLTPVFEANPKQVYVNLANRLKKDGL